MINRRTFLRLGMNASAMVLAAGCGSQAQAEMLSTEQLTLPIANLPPQADGFKIVAMSDFHVRTNSELFLYESAVDLANAMQPDVVTLLGDFINSTAEPIDLLSPILGRLKSRYGTYAVMGNHEYDSDPNLIMRSLESNDIQVLRNAGTTIGDALLYLAGLDDAWFEREDYEQALANQPTNTPTVLMAHEPDIADDSAQYPGIALQLSGHSHGGQIRLPLAGAPILPRLGEKYDMGLYQIDEMWLYTTRGVGTNNLPYRVNCPPEVTEITLVSADSNDGVQGAEL